MAGEVSTDTAIKVIGWVSGGLVYGAGLVMYVKMQLKSHGKQLEEHKGMIVDLQTKQASGVRPQDLADLKRRIEEQQQQTDKKLDLILEVIRAQRQ